MADDHRYSWLDDKAAERLLRGEPVEGQHGTPDGRNDRPHAEAERLAAVLGAVAEAGRRTDGAAADGTAPLPGEEAAVAAFRAAHAKPSVVAISAEGQVRDKSTRIARPADPAAPRTGWRGTRRPLRAGMVAAIAGCALSGFAVAAAAGVLPFGQSGGTPGPGASVSDTGPGSGESARPEISEDDGSPDPHAPGTSEGAQGRGVPGGDDGKGKHGKHDPHDKPGKQGKGKGSKPGAWNSGTGPDNGTGQRALGACRRYLAAEAGTGPGVGPEAMQKLKRAAGSRSAIHDYCVRLVGYDPVPRGGTDDTGTTAGTGDDSGSGDDGGSSNPAPPPPSGDDGGTPSPEPTPSSDTPSSTLSGTPSKELSDTPSGGSSETPSKDSATTPSDSATTAKSGAP
ncbi:hypothetical protein [Streptomyces botrytidirepellens]|uniref:Uncharacterized protein n=1 Tax=Streptomyces botrytidirepellens TaxID=2486417 RepID=A0A3M8T737_9ACTN|nr:hypothetical protein [Streptomyces botrytidirepellens]RNF89431.1 hypothetical protein EEJ42_41110 [Streptomyces botrytidirepellens]